jgi:diketogulonate reductase-like aldo/keto reductase
VSNYGIRQLDELIGATGQAPAVNQIPWSPRQHDPRLLEDHHARGVAVEGYSPLRGSRLGDRVLTEVAAAHGVTPAQVVLRWHLQHGIVVIPKSANRERIAANVDLLGFSLSDEEVERIDALSTR